MQHVSRTMLLTAGILAVILAIIGIALPLLPTTPFLLLAAYCFSKSSTTLHQWLLASPLLGSVIRDWENTGTISVKTKYTATLMISGVLVYSSLFHINSLFVIAFMSVSMTCVLLFIWSRPSGIES